MRFSTKPPLALLVALACALPIPAYAGGTGAPEQALRGPRDRMTIARGDAGGAAFRTKSAIGRLERWVGKGIRRVNKDRVLDAVNPLEVYKSRILGTSHERLASKAFFSGPGPIVGVNGVASGEMYREAADFMTGCEQPNVHQSRVDSPESLIDYLVQVRRKAGPIEKLVIAAHGSRGSMMINGTPLDAPWARSNAHWLAALPGDLFAPDAQVALISCSTAAGYLGDGKYGVNALREIFSPLMKQGGTVVASRRYVNPALGRIPERYKNGYERFCRHVIFAPVGAIAGTINWVISDWTTKHEKIAEIGIEPWGRGN